MERTYKTTAGLRAAYRSGKYKQQDTEYIDTDATTTYCIDFSFTSGGRRLTIDEVLICQPTGKMKDGYPLIDVVPCQTADPDILYQHLAEMYA